MIIKQQKIKDYLYQWGDIEPSKFFVFEVVSSTNDIAWKLLDQGHQSPLIIIASQQTAGRGQWGRTWNSTQGGLYLSIALKVNIKTIKAPHLTLLTAWGIANELHNYHLPVKLKWPNDLILQGRKLGGIKTETRNQRGMITQGIIGIGINWQNKTPATGINLHTFFKTQKTPSITSLEQLAAITIYGVFKSYQYYLDQGIEPILNYYLQILDSLGRTVMIEGIPGIITGVTPQGELKVSLKAPGAKTEIKLPPGTISLGYP